MGVIFVVLFIAYISGFIYMLISSSGIEDREIPHYEGVTPITSKELNDRFLDSFKSCYKFKD